jgi:hypothetical protein
MEGKIASNGYLELSRKGKKVDAKKAIEAASKPLLNQPDASEFFQEAQRLSALHHYVSELIPRISPGTLAEWEKLLTIHRSICKHLTQQPDTPIDLFSRWLRLQLRDLHTKALRCH